MLAGVCLFAKSKVVAVLAWSPGGITGRSGRYLSSGLPVGDGCSKMQSIVRRGSQVCRGADVACHNVAWAEREQEGRAHRGPWSEENVRRDGCDGWGNVRCFSFWGRTGAAAGWQAAGRHRILAKHGHHARRIIFVLKKPLILLSAHQDAGVECGPNDVIASCCDTSTAVACLAFQHQGIIPSPSFSPPDCTNSNNRPSGDYA